MKTYFGSKNKFELIRARFRNIGGLKWCNLLALVMNLNYKHTKYYSWMQDGIHVGTSIENLSRFDIGAADDTPSTQPIGSSPVTSTMGRPASQPRPHRANAPSFCDVLYNELDERESRIDQPLEGMEGGCFDCDGYTHTGYYGHYRGGVSPLLRDQNDDPSFY